MKVVVERIESMWLRGELIRLGAKERPIEDTVVIDVLTRKVCIRQSFRTSFVLESGVIVYPESPGEVCATFDGGYHQVVGLLVALGLLPWPRPTPDVFPSYSAYSHSTAIPA